MKNKLVKKNMTKFDYRARRLGIAGLFLLTITLSVGLPILTSLSNTNRSLTHDINVMENQNDDTVSQTKVERK
ncbi:MAG: hypothetical protein SOW55_00630 [Bacilli bacterium]|nr:hypothetical protein [Bacillales bacterium]MDY2574481.1 hypothetical protein [Bacilli bacterium]